MAARMFFRLKARSPFLIQFRLRPGPEILVARMILSRAWRFSQLPMQVSARP